MQETLDGTMQSGDYGRGEGLYGKPMHFKQVTAYDISAPVSGFRVLRLGTTTSSLAFCVSLFLTPVLLLLATEYWYSFLLSKRIYVFSIR